MSSVTNLLGRISAVILNPLIFLMFSVAILYFVFGVVKFIANAGDDKAREESKQSIIWGIVGMLIMISVYGIIRFALTNFGISTDIYPLTGN